MGMDRRCWLLEQMPSWNKYPAVCGAGACGDVMSVDAIHVSLRNALHHVVGRGRIVSDGALPISIQAARTGMLRVLPKE